MEMIAILVSVVILLTHPKVSHTSNIDILTALNVSHEIHGVIPVTGPYIYSTAWQFRPQFTEPYIPRAIIRSLTKHPSESLTFYMIAKQSRRTVGSLLFIQDSDKKIPKFQIISNLRHKHLFVRLCDINCYRDFTVQFPNPFYNHTKWMQLAIVVNSTIVSLYVNCQQPISVSLEMEIDFKISSNSKILFAQDKFHKRKFLGSVYHASISTSTYKRFPWKCKKSNEKEYQKDKPYSNKIQMTQETDGLQKQVQQLVSMVTLLKQQNEILSTRVGRLEQCECRPLCSHEGVIYSEGQTWQRDVCTYCVCYKGLPRCQLRWDIAQCFNPCSVNPCLNGGTCTGFSGYQNYTCVCPNTCYGGQCQYIRNPCVYDKDPGSCTYTQQRYTYDRYTKKCQLFSYTGCGGNANNFASLLECQSTCSSGACCHRNYKQTSSGTLKKTFLVDKLSDTCQTTDINTCRLSLKNTLNTNRIEVISFQAGIACATGNLADVCFPSIPGCNHGNKTYKLEEHFRSGCQDCVCKESGVQCRCSTISMRKELRDLTSDERLRFQKAVQQVRAGPNSAWEEMRDLYTTHAIHARHPQFFLPWHRIFLRRVEQKLQDFDCSVTLPYYDFTTDAANLSKSVLWQPNYFGGDGNVTRGACVPDHPFGGSDKWNPCIIRRFNPNINIPSHLEVALAYSSTNFTEFSLQMQSMIAYVHLYIGGDITTTEGPYDPVFLVLHSYIDMLYWHWQIKQTKLTKSDIGEPYLSFPMVPFKLAAQGVLNSESSLCVTYALPDKGHPCNITEQEYDITGFNRQGYDCRGFDSQGYDRDGFNLHGVDRNSQLDKRNMYRFEGYDQFGYSRAGFDRRGYDRCGYSTRGFNRDGYDVSGYDEHGFNRYGYNRNGVNRHGCSTKGCIASGLYGTDGYSSQCIDTAGLNREGHDQYGYDIHGYDVDYCNYTYMGPFAVKQSMRIYEILFMQKADFIKSLPRTCGPLQPIPDEWYARNWFGLPIDISVILPSKGAVDCPSTWSDQFCVNPCSILSECSCATSISTCSIQPCLGECAAYPGATCEIDFCDPDCNARWFHQGLLVDCANSRDCTDAEGFKHKHGSMWHLNPCESCRCMMGEVSCSVMQCPVVTCRHPQTAIGECCARCDGCTHEGRHYDNSQTFSSASNPCLSCKCSDNKVTCETLVCPVISLPCKHPVAKLGECCPSKCARCVERGVIYEHGQEWTSHSDRCKKCKCVEGAVSCVRTHTCRVDCPHGIRSKGKCCSPCTDCIHDGKIRKNGVTFVNQNGDTCQLCRCRKGYVSCTPRKRCPTLKCHIADRVKTTNDCCTRCKGCTDGVGAKHKQGSRWRNVNNACEMCSCLDSRIQCSRQPCPALACRQSATPPGGCCPVCTECVYNGQSYKDGQKFMAANSPCHKCLCSQGRVKCDNLSLKCKTICTHPGRVVNQCCPVCDGCEYNRRSFRNGQQFYPRGKDPCYKCLCKDGYVTCGTMRCPSVTCVRPITRHGQCCPRCPKACSYRGKSYRHDKRWQDKTNKCSECICNDGNVRCQRKSCPSPRCPHPATNTGGCCPRCEHCMYRRRKFSNSQIFIDPSDACRRCRCNLGAVQCTTISCAALTCTSTKLDTGQCCPVCDVKTCTLHGRTYQDGQRFPSPRDRCSACVCHKNAVQCEKRKCPVMSCRHPIQGECCPVCDGCSHNGVSYNNMARFEISGDTCQECQCVSGTVTCITEICQPTTCLHPMTSRGECCPKCVDCMYERRFYRNTQVFLDVRNECNRCTCSLGTVKCERSPCRKTKCSHPTTGKCCLECDNCLYRGRIMANGRRFPDSRDACKKCRCTNGNIVCSSTECPRVSCTHPIKDRCCQKCHDCFYGNQRYQNGQRFADTQNKCQECLCTNGNVRCREAFCPRVRCQHPAKTTGQCCKQCNECHYDSVQHRNGQVFNDRSDPCKECQCKDGTVSCKKPACPDVPCTHPAQGQCCKVCKDCSYNNRHYGNGKIFPDVNKCNQCTCKHGNVTCTKKECDTPACLHPAKGHCCLECRNCQYHGKEYVTGERFRDLSSCQECVCHTGSVQCSAIKCPAPSCRHSVQKGCCRQCTGCHYQGKQYKTGDSFPQPSNPLCHICTCRKGNVKCVKKACSVVRCQNPSIGSCGCPTCDGCRYLGRSHDNGDSFPSPQNPCQRCSCSNGNVLCHRKPCTSSCRHPSKEKDCCPVCTQCTYEGQEYKNGVQFISARDKCMSCFCRDGNVNCDRVQCPRTNCPQPVLPPGGCCKTCSDCVQDGITHRDKSEFPHSRDKCQVCHCKVGIATCNKIHCTTHCTHPIPGKCCPQCTDCIYRDKVYTNGKLFKPQPCKNCHCQKGNIQCTTERCPPLSCSLTVKTPGQCCAKCQGCTYKNKRYDSGDSWTSDVNPCMSCQCLGGVVTCAEIRCLAPCPNPVPVADQCCPTCPTCELNGRMYQQGESFTPNGDPCDRCTCQDGKLLCMRAPCPSLVDCPKEQMIGPRTGECCPTCAGFATNCSSDTRGLKLHPQHDPCVMCECMDFSWVCIQDICLALTCPVTEQYTPDGQCCSQCAVCHVGDVTHKDGDIWKSSKDACITLQCVSGAVKKKIQSCSSLVCSQGSTLHRPPGECCHVCKNDSSQVCTYSGKSFQQNEKWKADECTTCHCLQGKSLCRRKRCPALACLPAEAPTLVPGQCCPKCIAEPATCIVYGDPHYRTFDGATIHFQGTCKYVMSKDCESGDFTVEVQHDNHGRSSVSWAYSLTVHYKGIVIDLLQNNTVKINGHQVQLPFLRKPELYIEVSANTILFNTEIGLKVSWNGDSYAEVSVPGNYKRKMCGLCGNFNSFPQDDMRTRSNQITPSVSMFGNSWKVSGSLSRDGKPCKDAKAIDPCNKVSYNVRKLANAKCAILKGPLFRKCHPVVKPETFYASCVYDLCVCSQEPDCLCNVLSSYALECAKAGIHLQWRSAALCATGCQSDLGFVFDECGPPCPRTCDNKDVKHITSQCFKPCVPGCQCFADKVLHNERCISAKDCPDNTNTVYR